VATFRFTWTGTNPSQDTWKKVCDSIQVIGPSISPLIDAPNVCGNVRQCRARVLARDVDAHVVEIGRVI
jgi:hypothetical protein